MMGMIGAPGSKGLSAVPRTATRRWAFRSNNRRSLDAVLRGMSRWERFSTTDFTDHTDRNHRNSCLDPWNSYDPWSVFRPGFVGLRLCRAWRSSQRSERLAATGSRDPARSVRPRTDLRSWILDRCAACNGATFVKSASLNGSGRVRRRRGPRARNRRAGYGSDHLVPARSRTACACW